MTIKRVLTTVVLVAISTILFVGWVFYLLHEEDYYPKPGTFPFYLKLSSLVRNIPIANAVSVPSYHGSTGDGPKPAHSSVCYGAQSSKEVWILANTGSYLHKHGFALDLIEAHPSIFRIDEPKPLHSTAYVNKEGQSVHLVLSASPNAEEVKVCFTHYE